MRYICQICGYIYDDEREQAPFESLPENWRCPLCGARKADFRPEAAESAPPRPLPAAPADFGEQKLTPGQLAALCSNLARGCEKQYRAEEAGLFRELAAWFTAAVPAVEDPTVEALAARLQQDTAAYPGLRAEADAAGDRGAARVCVWGEKVTRMLSSLVERYLQEGEEMLADTEVWVCTACGFVWIGDAPPEACPVCRVPAWKFEKAEGRATA